MEDSACHDRTTSAEHVCVRQTLEIIAIDFYP